jgi:hypothetical protein
LKRAVAALAFLASLVAFAVFVGGGLFLLLVESSGERGTGALLALGGIIAFAATLALIFARDDIIDRVGRSAGASVAAFVAVLPVAALAFGAFRFAGLPIGSSLPRLDWAVFAVGLLLGLGAASILLLGYRRAMDASNATVAHEAQPHANDPAPQKISTWAEMPRLQFDAEEEVRVTRVR